MQTVDNEQTTVQKWAPSVEKQPSSGSQNTKPLVQEKAPRNPFVTILTISFGISAWIGVNSIFNQLPLIVPSAPEGWQLPSYIVVTIQLANIGSFGYVLYQKFSRRKIDDGFLIYGTMAIGCAAAIGMSFFYQETVEIAGVQHSVALLVFTLMFALVGCLSSVLFMPYMGRFRECYLVTYLLGLGFSGFIVSILSMIQGIGGPIECIPNNSTDGPAFIKYVPPPVFGSDIYFLLVFGAFVLSTIAFVLLNTLSVCKKEYAGGSVDQGNTYRCDETNEIEQLKDMVPDDVRNLSRFNYGFLMACLMGLSSLDNGIFPALMTYYCLPYGNMTYYLTVVLAAFLGPGAGIVAMFVPHTSIRVVRVLSVIGTILAVYMIFIAANSPSPILQDSIFGSILVVSG